MKYRFVPVTSLNFSKNRIRNSNHVKFEYISLEFWKDNKKLFKRAQFQIHIF